MAVGCWQINLNKHPPTAEEFRALFDPSEGAEVIEATDNATSMQGLFDREVVIAFPGMEMLYYWLALAGLVLFGVAFLQAGLPAWLGYLTVGTTLPFGIVFLVSGGRTGFLTPGLVALLSLVIAIFLLRQLTCMER